jgi:hypothetical protein
VVGHGEWVGWTVRGDEDMDWMIGMALYDTYGILLFGSDTEKYGL